jgi:hypothetical protein
MSLPAVVESAELGAGAGVELLGEGLGEGLGVEDETGLKDEDEDERVLKKVLWREVAEVLCV